MKHFLLFGILFLAVANNLVAQQLSNPGFESWEDAGTVLDEPVKWSSIKTSDAGDFINNFAPIVWGQVTDAHSGLFSLELTNVMSIVMATGTITNGRVHAEVTPANGYVFTDPADDKWHMAMTSRPDSVVIWAKYLPQGGDTAQVKVLLHKGAGTLPPKPENQDNRVGYAQINITAQVNEWTRFAAPFTYSSDENPEYLLTVLTAGAGTLAVEGSKVFYDDMELVYGSSSIGDVVDRAKNLIYLSEQSLRFDRFASHVLNQSTIEIIDLQGAVVFKSTITNNEVNIGKLHLTPALYVVRISGQEISYSQKLYLN
jgi:hypothetical protein